MKYLKLFKTHSEYENYTKEGMEVFPNISVCIDQDDMHYNSLRTDMEVVDLGLPSGLKWAKWNLGGEKETDFGKYYQYGEIYGSYEINNTTSRTYHFSNMPFNNGADDYDREYFESIVDEVCPNSTLSLEYDAAYNLLGEGYRMPTADEYVELIANTNTEWTSINGVSGLKATSKLDSNKYIFFPAAGNALWNNMYHRGTDCNYWSSTLEEDFSIPGAYSMHSNDYIPNPKSGSYRYDGFNIRAVYEN